jgi:hypothetical protein
MNEIPEINSVVTIRILILIAVAILSFYLLATKITKK